MAKIPNYVTQGRWRAGVKFLMGLGTNPELTADDQRKLRECFRGPFANGMKRRDAERMLRDHMRWTAVQTQG